MQGQAGVQQAMGQLESASFPTIASRRALGNAPGEQTDLQVRKVDSCER